MMNYLSTGIRMKRTGAPRLAPFETWEFYPYFVIPSVVEGPCVCSALHKQAQVSKNARR